MPINIIKIITKEEDIKKVVDRLRNYSFDQIAKDFHFEFSVMEKLTDINKLKDTFPKFDLIKSIEIRENYKKEIHYGLNYELLDGTYVIIVVVLDPIKGKGPIIINGFHAKKSYKQFEKSLRKNYGNKFI
ncbi:hypothetical protein HYW74_03185 [Candidatus Pacearchaeota archaeon]|nr:hypothetical protein [Candidatus Pacearchaeota archaeon]